MEGMEFLVNLSYKVDGAKYNMQTQIRAENESYVYDEAQKAIRSANPRGVITDLEVEVIRRVE